MFVKLHLKNMEKIYNGRIHFDTGTDCMAEIDGHNF